MQLSDNTVPGNYQQPIRNFTGRIVSNFVEEVDFVPNSNMRIWYNNKAEDYPTHRHSCLEIAIPLSGPYTYVFEDRTIEIDNEGHTNVIVIEDGTVRMESSSCKNQICVDHGRISLIGDSIVCLPNRVVVEIEGKGGDADVISG